MDENYIDPMAEDEREIAAILRDECSYWVGQAGITKIVIYQEPGQMFFVNYAAVYFGNQILCRVDLSGWTVQYKVKQEYRDDEIY